MNKKLVILLFVLVSSCIVFVSAEPILNIENQVVAKETVIGEILGAEQGLTQDDLKIYEGRREMSFEKEIIFYNSSYYFYFIPIKEGIFNLEIDGVLYKENNGLKEKSFEEEISVSGNTTQVLSVKPGAVYSSSPFVFLTNSGDEAFEVSYNEETISLNAGASKKVLFTPETEFSYFVVSSYRDFKVPVVYLEFNGTENTIGGDVNISENETKKIDVEIKPVEIEIKALANEAQDFSVTVLNYGEMIEDIQVNSKLKDLEIFSPEKIERNEKINFSFSSDKTGYFQDNVSIKIHGIEKIINVNIYVFPENSTEAVLETKEKSCVELNGKLCASGEDCVGSVEYAGGFCCLGECKKIGGESSKWGWLIGLVFLGVALGGVYYFYKKYKRFKPETLHDKFKKTDTNLSKRTHGSLTKN